MDNNINTMSIEELTKLKEQLQQIDSNNSLINKINEKINLMIDSNNIMEKNKRFQLATEFMNQAKKVYDLILKCDFDKIKDDVNDMIETRLNRFIYFTSSWNGECVNYNSKKGVDERWSYVHGLVGDFWREHLDEIAEATFNGNIKPSENPYDKVKYKSIEQASWYIPRYKSKNVNDNWFEDCFKG